MAKQEKKNRIKITDLPKEHKVSEEEMKHVTGGGLTYLHQKEMLTSPTLSLPGLASIWGTNGTSVWGSGNTDVWGSGNTDVWGAGSTDLGRL